MHRYGVPALRLVLPNLDRADASPLILCGTFFQRGQHTLIGPPHALNRRLCVAQGTIGSGPMRRPATTGHVVEGGVLDAGFS